MEGEAKHYRYLIVGGGMTADAAARGIRSVDPAGSIGLIGAELDAPYNRPPLSKALWKGKSVDKIFRKTAERGVELHLGRRVTSIDPAEHCVVDDEGVRYTYEKLLLATGGFPRRLPFDSTPDAAAEGRRIIYYRTLPDYRDLREVAERGQDFLVIGGGFIGSEVAAALTLFGRQVTMIFPDELIGQRIFPRDLAAFVTDYYRQKGVTILSGASAIAVERTGLRATLRLRDKVTGAEREVEADAVVAGIGILPAVELAEAAGLQVDGGVVVDAGLRTTAPDIYAAGDVAKFYNPSLDKWLRVEHEDNANTMGATAGKSMAGDLLGAAEPVRYEHLPYFYSDLFDLGYEAVGELDSRLETVADWQAPFRKGVVYYLKEGRVRGVLLWDVWGKTDAARELIRQAGPFRAAELTGKIAAG